MHNNENVVECKRDEMRTSKEYVEDSEGKRRNYEFCSKRYELRCL